MMEQLLTSEGLLALITLTAMEIVLGIDNIVFISILVGVLPEEKRDRIRRLGLVLALASRLILLFCLSWLMGLTEPLFNLLNKSVSGRDLILLTGGLFLIGKATVEIHHKVEASEESSKGQVAQATAGMVLFQIALLDVVFSLDSVITAIGMVDEVFIMVIAMVVSMLVMLWSASGIGSFVDRHPTVKILALSFLILIGVMLVVEGMGQHVEKGYIYFAMFFSLAVELLNLRYRMNRGKRSTPGA